MPSVTDAAARMRYYCAEASVGYDQSNRWDVRDGGETDCSALVITCLREAGFDTGAATYTGNMSAELTARGWVRLPSDIGTCRVGDILLNDADHVAMVVSGAGWGATVAQASIDERGGISGGAAGDQTGRETNVRGVYDYPWDCILRYAGDAGQDVPQPEYHSFRAGKWGPWRRAGRATGKRGKPFYDFEAANLGPGGWFQLTLEGGEVLPRNRRNEAREKRVIGITVYYVTPYPASTGYYRAKYRARPLGCGWLKWEYDDEDGGAGDDVHPIDKFRMSLSR